MNNTYIYLTLTITAALCIAILVYINWKSSVRKYYSLLPGIAIGFVLAGLFAGKDRLSSFALMGIGVIVALFDLRVKKIRIRHEQGKEEETRRSPD